MSSGERYEAKVPDTLDLAERARIAVNGLTGALDPQRSYMPYHRAVFYADPPYMSHVGGNMVYWTGNELWGKQVETLIKMRIMSGSDLNIDLEEQSVVGMIACLEDDGIWYAEVSKVEGDEIIKSEDHAPLLAQARVILALALQYEMDGNTRWSELIRKMVQGLANVAFYSEDYAYYPVTVLGGTLCMPRSGWPNSDEPEGLSMYEHGWHASSAHTAFAYGGIIRALCRWYTISGDEEALVFAGKLVNFMLKPKNWQPEADPKAVVSAEHGHFEGHVHAYCWGFWALLDYAVLTNNDRIKSFVRDGYEYIRNFGIARIGLFAEGCTVGDMTNLAIGLSDAGIGDYWDDVDRYVRNHLTEIQQLRPDLLQAVAAPGPEHEARSGETSDSVIERNIGNLFADATHVSMMTPGGIYCCTENGLIAYYHAWEAIVRCTDGVARVNLLLNRASPWLDIDSHLPYEGKVVIRNKTARVLSVRIPGWVSEESVRSSINGQEAHPFWLNRHLVFDAVTEGDTISIEFPMLESVETYRNGWEGVKLPGHTEMTLTPGLEPPAEPTEYTCRFRGNTLMDVSPRDQGRGYPIYLRDHYKEARAPLRKVTRYISPEII